MTSEPLNLLHASLQQVREHAAGRKVLVSPHHVTAASAAAATAIVSVAGYPSGRHHSLIKASEARLAVQSGAAEIWVAVDATLDDATSLLSELVTIREACPQPVRLGVITTRGEVEALARQAGYDEVVGQLPAPHCQG